MKTIEIKHRSTNKVLFTTEVEDNDQSPLRAAVIAANLADANLAGADLADADLAGANLAGADLADANLAGADLADADLAGADLADAYLADANLARANLAGADLADANLAGANLARANLAGAYLAGANLADAYLARANLAGAYLADAYLADANLARANLAGAYLADANLADAYLARANLAGADLADADLAGARNVPSGVMATSPAEPYVRETGTDPERHARRAARYRERNPNVPVVDRLDARILESVTTGGGSLDMSSWHTCKTTHCRAGWAIHHAGKAGYDLESEIGSQEAGRAIYLASTGRSPHFFATNERALEDIKRWAEGNGK